MTGRADGEISRPTSVPGWAGHVGSGTIRFRSRYTTATTITAPPTIVYTSTSESEWAAHPSYTATSASRKHRPPRPRMDATTRERNRRPNTPGTDRDQFLTLRDWRERAEGDRREAVSLDVVLRLIDPATGKSGTRRRAGRPCPRWRSRRSRPKPIRSSRRWRRRGQISAGRPRAGSTPGQTERERGRTRESSRRVVPARRARRRSPARPRSSPIWRTRACLDRVEATILTVSIALGTIGGPCEQM